VVEPYLRRSALAGHNLVARAAEAPADAGVLLAERAHRTQINLRGDGSDASFLQAAEKAVGFALPVAPNTTNTDGELTALWLGPSEWLLVAPPAREAGIMGRLRAGLVGLHAAVTDVSEARTIILVAGPRARDLLAKGTPLDLHPRVFGTGQCAQTALAKANVILRQIDDRPTFEVYILKSFSDYLFTWLERAAAEYGLAVMADG
jgi:sarcosine oxidase, subunit gamma